MEHLQTHTPAAADKSQLDALAYSCGVVRWENPTIIMHSGSDALDLLHRLTTKDLLSVSAGHARRTVLTSAKGRVVDVFLVAHVSENLLLLISDTNESERTVAAIDYYTIIEDAELLDLSDSRARISLVGPTAHAVVEAVFGLLLDTDSVAETPFGASSITIVSDSSRGVIWIDVICEIAIAESVLKALDYKDTTPVDESHFELFRIGNEIPGSNREYGEHANPIEAGLLPLIDFDKGCYVGQEVIARLDAYDKVQRNIKVLRSSVPLNVGAKLVSGTTSAGLVTSASTLSTESGDFLSLGLVRKAFLHPDTELDVENGATAKIR
ncbi:MAG: hypothetical protein HQ477_10550 [Chloroflexi bacterium]|nr:hypothetical protein [Chloroflexota bacterium]